MKQFNIKRSFVTENYSLFKPLLGNRGISAARIRKIKESIESVGYMPSRIIVNEKNEVIDGQCRLQVFKEYGLPVHVDVVPGIGIKECIAMNINQTNWKIDDYISSYAAQGNENYKRLQKLLKTFRAIGMRAILAAACDYKTGGQVWDYAKDGTIQISEKDYYSIAEKLDYVMQFKELFKTVGGLNHTYYVAIMFAYSLPGVSHERLAKKIFEKRVELYQTATLEQSLAVIEKIYNDSIRRNDRVYIRHEFELFKEGRK